MDRLSGYSTAPSGRPEGLRKKIIRNRHLHRRNKYKKTMKPGYRDKIIMHAFYPKRAPFFNSTTLKTVHFYACLFELADRGILKIENRHIVCSNTETGDEVLDKVLALVSPLSGKKPGRLQMLVPQKSPQIYKAQMEQMTEKLYLAGEDITFLFWKVGVRYTVRKHDLLKPSVKSLERSLVYGRKPDRDSWLTSILAAEAGVFKNIFTNREFRRKAKHRFSQLLKSEFHLSDPTIPDLHKSLKKTLTAQKASRSGY